MSRFVNQYFPGSITLRQLQKLTSKLLQHGINPKNTLIVYSLCVDEIEHRVESDLAEFGDPPLLWRTCRISFTSITGMGAAIDHVPEDGFLFIVYGPHVGIS